MRLRIKEWMALRDVSQAHIATALGVSRMTVSAWTEGRPGKDGQRVMVFPDTEAFEALCLFLECTPTDLLELETSRTPTGLVWRDFRHVWRGPGRPPASMRTAMPKAPTAATTPKRGRKTTARLQDEPASARAEAPPEFEAVVPAPVEHDIEEIVLFPEHLPPRPVPAPPAIAPAVAPPEPAWEGPRSSDELLGFHGNAPLASLREWLGVQLRQLGTGATSPERMALLAAHMKVLERLNHFADLGELRTWLAGELSRLNARLRQAPDPALEATRGAYTKALNKLVHYARQD